MASLRPRPDTGQLFFDFRWQGKRYRAQTAMQDSTENRNQLAPKLRHLNLALKAGTFSMAAFFPELAGVLADPPVLPSPPASGNAQGQMPAASTPNFGLFAEQWFNEFKVGWRRTYVVTVRGILDKYLLPKFGMLHIGAVSRAQILDLRSTLAQASGRKAGTKLSPARINTIMLILRQILQEAADRHEFTVPMARIKPLKIRKSDVQPFTLEQVQLLVKTVRPDYRDYLTTRFFTGMRSGELHGLKWKYVDFERRLILVRETIVAGEEEYTKTDSSQRDIQMSQPVFDALKHQHKATGNMTYVFCNRQGEPIDTTNFTKRVWYPLLRHLSLEARRPYQIRHTAATLWLSAGESPDWIARMLGHVSTELLFSTYTRFVPNLTKRDGSAFDQLIAGRFGSSGSDLSDGPSNKQR